MDKQSSMTRFLADRGASVAVMSALVATVLVGMAALALDVGQFYYVKRRLQTATDIAALAAAADSDRAEAAASANMTDNGFPASAMVSVRTGDIHARSGPPRRQPLRRGRQRPERRARDRVQ